MFQLPEILSDSVSYISVRRFWYAVTVNGSLKTVFSISIIPELVQYVYKYSTVARASGPDGSSISYDQERYDVATVVRVYPHLNPPY